MLAIVLVGLGAVAATSLVFFEVGLSEDRERARARRSQRGHTGSHATLAGTGEDSLQGERPARGLSSTHEWQAKEAGRGAQGEPSGSERQSRQPERPRLERRRGYRRRLK